MNENIFDKLDFGPLRALLDNDDITDISFDNNGQIWVRSLTQGSLRVEVEGVTPEFIEKLAFQCSNVMGTTFNNAKPFLDAESSELRLNFVHQSIATNGIAMVIRKTPAKIRLEKEKLLKDEYFTQDIHDILIKCVEGHCNIIVCGETGSGKTEFVKFLASHTKTNEKIITIEDTLELHLDKIFPQRDIVAMKTNNVASYTDVLVTCMRQNPKWILLSEVRSAEAVSAVRNSISSGHNILSTIHADKASAIPYRLYSLMETDLDVNQFLTTIYRYIQLGVHIKAYYSKEKGKFHREVDEVVEFYVDEENRPQSHIIYQKQFGKEPIMRKPSSHLTEYLENQNIDISSITSHIEDVPFEEENINNEVPVTIQPEIISDNQDLTDTPLVPEIQIENTNQQSEIDNSQIIENNIEQNIDSENQVSIENGQIQGQAIVEEPMLNIMPEQNNTDSNVEPAVIQEIPVNIQPEVVNNAITVEQPSTPLQEVTIPVPEENSLTNTQVESVQPNNNLGQEIVQPTIPIDIPIIGQTAAQNSDVTNNGIDINNLASLDVQESN